jgi:hypothetical protein
VRVPGTRVRSSAKVCSYPAEVMIKRAAKEAVDRQDYVALAEVLSLAPGDIARAEMDEEDRAIGMSALAEGQRAVVQDRLTMVYVHAAMRSSEEPARALQSAHDLLKASCCWRNGQQCWRHRFVISGQSRSWAGRACTPPPDVSDSARPTCRSPPRGLSRGSHARRGRCAASWGWADAGASGCRAWHSFLAGVRPCRA